MLGMVAAQRKTWNMTVDCFGVRDKNWSAKNQKKT
jgi:hypothetical protein